MYALCFKIIDKVTCKFDLKIEKALPINWGKPNLNAQLKCYSGYTRDLSYILCPLNNHLL